MKTIVTGYCVALLLTGLVLSMASPGAAQNLVVNGDFETDADLFVTWPGYVAPLSAGNPENITGWTGEGGHGINPVVPGGPDDAPFRDNGNNTTSVAFLQGNSAIQQTVTGFTIGKEYVMDIDFNARNCCGDPLDVPIATVLLDDQVVASSVDLFPPPGGVTPVGGENPWHSPTGDTVFEATAESLTLRITAAPAAGGDTTLLVDNISIELVPEPSAALLALVGLVGLMRYRTRRK